MVVERWNVILANSCISKNRIVLLLIPYKHFRRLNREPDNGEVDEGAGLKLRKTEGDKQGEGPIDDEEEKEMWDGRQHLSQNVVMDVDTI